MPHRRLAMLHCTGPPMSEELIADFRRLSCDADFWSLRLTDERAESYAIRKDVAQPPFLLSDRGAMLTVHAAGGCGYAATSDVSRAGLQSALDRAASWARAAAPRSLID